MSETRRRAARALAAWPHERPAQEMRSLPVRDLCDRADIELLVRQFYTRALFDELLFDHFSGLRGGGLEGHLPTMCDFWESALLRSGQYRGNPLALHQRLHEEHPLGTAQFSRWLQIWTETVDELFTGPTAEQAKQQAARIAWALHRRVVGFEAPELLERLAGADPRLALRIRPAAGGKTGKALAEPAPRAADANARDTP